MQKKGEVRSKKKKEISLPHVSFVVRFFILLSKISCFLDFIHKIRNSQRTTNNIVFNDFPSFFLFSFTVYFIYFFWEISTFWFSITLLFLFRSPLWTFLLFLSYYFCLKWFFRPVSQKQVRAQEKCWKIWGPARSLFVWKEGNEGESWTHATTKLFGNCKLVVGWHISFSASNSTWFTFLWVFPPVNSASEYKSVSLKEKMKTEKNERERRCVFNSGNEFQYRLLSSHFFLNPETKLYKTCLSLFLFSLFPLLLFPCTTSMIL